MILGPGNCVHCADRLKLLFNSFVCPNECDLRGAPPQTLLLMIHNIKTRESLAPLTTGVFPAKNGIALHGPHLIGLKCPVEGCGKKIGRCTLSMAYRRFYYYCFPDRLDPGQDERHYASNADHVWRVEDGNDA